MGSAAGRDTAVTRTAGLMGCSSRRDRGDHVRELYSGARRRSASSGAVRPRLGHARPREGIMDPHRRRPEGSAPHGEDRRPVRIPGVAPLRASRRAARDRRVPGGRRAARVLRHRDARGRAARAAAAQGRDRQGGVRAAPPPRRGGRRGHRRRPLPHPRPALRPHRPARALRARAPERPRLPLPALPDPEGVARRAPPGRPVPRVLPGRSRRDRPGHPARPRRGRGRDRDGGDPLSPAAAAGEHPRQHPPPLRGLLPRDRLRGPHPRAARPGQAPEDRRRRRVRPAARRGRCERGAGAEGARLRLHPHP